MNIFQPAGMSGKDRTLLLKKLMKEDKKKLLNKDVKSGELVELLLEGETTAIQILILHYLDFLDKIDLPNTKKSILLAILFKLEGVENVRKKLSDISKIKTPENLSKLQTLFGKLGMENCLLKVEKDLKRKSRV